MGRLSQRSTVYFDPLINQALKLRAASTDVSVSELVDDAVRLLMREDQADLSVLSERVHEPEVSYEEFLTDLINAGKVSKPIQ